MVVVLESDATSTWLQLLLLLLLRRILFLKLLPLVDRLELFLELLRLQAQLVHYYLLVESVVILVSPDEGIQHLLPFVLVWIIIL